MWTLFIVAALADPPSAEGPDASEPVPSEEPDPTESVDDESEDDSKEEVPPDAPRVYTIEIDEPLGSALDTLDGPVETEGNVQDLLLGLERPVLFRHRWYVKPQVSVAHLDGRTAARLGISLGHQWFPVRELPIQVAGENRLLATAPVGGATGRRVELSATAGPWLGPVGLQIGPAARYDRWTSPTATLDDAIAVGARATVGLDLDVVQPFVGVEPVWLVWGDRDPWGPVGELSFLAGLGIATKFVRIGVQGSWRETSVGPLIDAGLTLHVRPR